MLPAFGSPTDVDRYQMKSLFFGLKVHVENWPKA